MEQLSTLYHGSDTTVNSPSLDRGKPNNDNFPKKLHPFLM